MRISAPLAVIVGALLGGLALPFALQRERPAKAAFEYVPPAGFTPATGEAKRKLTQGNTEPHPGTDSFLPVPEADLHPDRKAWVAEPKSPFEPAPRIVQVHNDGRGSIDETVLGQISAEMVEHQRAQGLVYTPSAKKVLVRPDGARVGLLVWNVESAPESTQPKTLPRQAAQLSFSDNDGLSIVTAQYLVADEARIEPGFEASANTAQGVAIRPAPLALWIRLLAAVGLGALGYALARWSARPRRGATETT